MKVTLGFAMISLMALLTGCGQDTPEERLEAAGERLQQAEITLEEIEQQIGRHQDELVTLTKQRRKMKDRLLTLEERLAARATDVALFRAVQAAILATSELEQSAIAVQAEDGVITLSGIVAEQAEKDSAILVASETPGVARVVSRISIDDPAADSSQQKKPQ
jgi:osmotically-inducible protein OsmY